MAADRFDLGRLRAICETKLCETIDLESVIGTLVLAERNHAPNLKQACLQYVASNLSDIIGTEGYKEMSMTCRIYRARFYEQYRHYKTLAGMSKGLPVKGNPPT